MEGTSFFGRHPAEMWCAWAGATILVGLVCGARQSARPVLHPNRFVVLRLIAALALGLPFVAVLYGRWEFAPVGAGGHAANCAHIRMGVALFVMLCDALLMGSALWGLVGIAVGVCAGQAAVECLHVAAVLGVPSRAAWAQYVAMAGFLLVALLAVPITGLRSRRRPAARDVWERSFHRRSFATALLLSVVPGLGGYYATRAHREMEWLTGFLGALGAGYVLLVPLWRRVLFYGTPQAGAGPVMFLLLYVILAATAASIALPRMKRKGRIH